MIARGYKRALSAVVRARRSVIQFPWLIAAKPLPPGYPNSTGMAQLAIAASIQSITMKYIIYGRIVVLYCHVKYKHNAYFCFIQ